MNGRSWAVWMSACMLVGCGPATPELPEPPEGILALDSFAQVYAEAQLIEAAGKHGMFREDDEHVRLAAAYADLFRRTGVSEARYRESFTWWFSHPEAMPEVLFRATDRLNDLERDENGVRYVPAPVDTNGTSPSVTPGKTLRPRKAAQPGN